MNHRPCTLVPTFDNERTLADVVRGALAHLPVVVVDDGSTDATPAILAALSAEHPRLTVVTHDRNRGKGAALRTGLSRARELGFSHAISIDSDGQHLPEDISLLREASERRPDALTLGCRDIVAAGAGRGSRFGLAVSNFWTFVETGHRLPDTQTGFRCYPLASIGELQLDCTGYDFEVEVLVKASWAGVPIESVPVRVRYFAGAERVSHMRPVADFLRISRLNTRLCTLRCCFPLPYLALRVQRRFHALGLGDRLRESFRELLLREPGSPARIAGSVGLGLFLGIAPFWGLQIALTILLSHLLNASKTVAVIASNISFPLMIPFILGASLVLGRMALGGEGDLEWYAPRIERADLWAYVLGAFLLAALVAATGAAVTFVLAKGYQRIRRRA